MSGRQDYVITYTVDGALNAFDDHDELYWNAIGAEWEVPIVAAAVDVVATPQPLDAAGLLRRAGGQQPAVRRGGAADGSGALFAQPEGLAPYSALTVVVGLPKGAVTATGPHLEEH